VFLEVPLNLFLKKKAYEILRMNPEAIEGWKPGGLQEFSIASIFKWRGWRLNCLHF